VRGRSHRLIGCVLVPLTGFLLVLGIPEAGPAQSPRAGSLRQKQASLAGEARHALVQLYGLESQLAQARGRLATLDARAAELARSQASARNRLGAARRTLVAAQRLLGRQVRILYQSDQPDAIAIVLGAASLDNAIEGLEAVRRTARATASIVSAAREARARLQIAERALADRIARTRAARAKVASTAAALGRARIERSGYLERLRRDQELTAAEIARLEERARSAQRSAAEIARRSATVAQATRSASPEPLAASESAATTASAAPSEPPPSPVESVSGGESAPPPAAPSPPQPGGTMTVYATGYCLRGSTATGLPVGPGVVAVDPTVIPLGTRMTIPGYGEGVAADVGGAIKGARIDVWIGSCARAAAFARTVTITFR
jgi:3D (Asp-Asp-Asp) domain-containing protein/peptidoglycan hydrolase CwlO-like protein